MQQLAKHEAGEFLKRFGFFGDCLLRKVEIVYESGPSRSVSVWIEARDYAEKEREVWVCVHLTIRGVGDFCFADRAKETNVVLTFGVHILWSENCIGLDFSHFADQPESVEELLSSKVFAIGNTLEWQVESYPFKS